MANEDFTTYTEVDPTGHTTVAADKVTVAAFTNGEISYTYKDYNSGLFPGDFSIQFQYYQSTAGNVGSQVFQALSNVVGTLNSQPWTTNNSLWVQLWKKSGVWNISGNECSDGSYRGSTTGYDLSTATDYWITVARVGSLWTIKVYSNSGRTTLLATLSRTLYAIKSFRYVYPICGIGDGASTLQQSSYIKDLNLNLPAGGFLTRNYWWERASEQLAGV